jgi:uncharacterized membrane protein YhiD involved in acid resistance
MALVSLASCLFSIGSAYAFRSGPQSWDASRISAAIPSGVGFLGAGLIFKESIKTGEAPEGFPIVHGLTTAASLWMSAAVGIACGGELYFVSTYTTGLLLLLLRFSPRILGVDFDNDDDDDEDNHTMEQFAMNGNYGGVQTHSPEQPLSTEASLLKKLDFSASERGLDSRVSRKNTRYFPSLR